MPDAPEPAAILRQRDHRPWPVPDRRWVMTQRWHALLFAHWPVDPAHLRPLLPDGLALDTFDGEAWIGIVPFAMSHVRLRGLPALPLVSSFAEINVRTYVSAGGRSGVWFFSLDAGSSLAVAAARLWYRLPYHRARMAVRRDGEAIEYHSRRDGGGAEFRARYGPTGAAGAARPGSLEHFLTERYCLFIARGGALWRGDIHHAPWPLQPAECELRANTMVSPTGLRLPETAPVLHYADRLDVLLWTLRSADRAVAARSGDTHTGARTAAAGGRKDPP